MGRIYETGKTQVDYFEPDGADFEDDDFSNDDIYIMQKDEFFEDIKAGVIETTSAFTLQEFKDIVKSLRANGVDI